MDKIKYYGFMVDELTGNVENLKTVKTNEYVPLFERLGFAYAKRFTNYKEFIDAKEYTIKQIKVYRKKHKVV